MVTIGKRNRVQVVSLTEAGAFVRTTGTDTVLVSQRELPPHAQVGDWLELFAYREGDRSLALTSQQPKLMLGQCALLKVKEVGEAGAFLDWGLGKDLLVPFSEQHKPMELGRSYVVTLLRDKHTDRLFGSSKLNRHLPETGGDFQPRQPVQLLVWGRSDMGYKTVVNQTHLGLLFRDDAFKPLKYGQQIKGFIKTIRSDGKIDVSLQLPGGAGRDELVDKILAHLRACGGSSPLTDSAAPDDIYHQFNVSKKNYKRALGALYKQKRIAIEPHQIRLLE